MNDTGNTPLQRTASDRAPLFEAMVTAVRDYAIYMLDPSGCVVSWNEGARHIKGYAADEIIGRHFSVFYLPEDIAAHRPEQMLAAALRQGRFEGEGWRVRRDGSRFWANAVITPVYGSDNRLRGFAKVTRDISEWHAATQRLETLNARLTDTLESTNDAFYLLDSGWRFTYINRQAEQMLDQPRDRLLGRVIWDAFPALSGSRLQQEYRRVLRRRMPVQFEQAGADGHWYHMKACPADGGVAVYFQDITARKAAEETLRQNAMQLEALTRRLAEVQEAERQALARELHDQVGQNLTALNINLNIIMSSLPGPLAQALGPRLLDSMRLVEATLAATRDLMAELRPAVLDDYGLAVALRWQAEVFADRTGLRVDIVLDERVPRLSLAMEAALFRVAQEALTNVAKHADARRVKISLAPARGHVRLKVEDDGKGLPPDGVTRAPGHGLGLTAMQERLRAVGGRLSLAKARLGGVRLTAEVNMGANE